ncbi:unnamed protein product [Diatraea saccharalis]|uniref:Uncharacterized protein n=1 Tax=Diatraea saccharalis TaxID=40085 RepID=A0A9N9RHQ7_9NEOP|nr:unnamed protein product [Diatraea saccharalis]
MALTTILIVCIVAAANAGYVWVSDGASGYSPFQSSFRMPQIPPMPPMPAMPPMPPMPPGPAYTTIPTPSIPSMPSMPPMPPMPPMPSMPTVAPINLKEYTPGNNEHFVGVSTSSFSSSSNINGVKKEAAGTNTLINNNGHVDEKVLQYERNDLPK